MKIKLLILVLSMGAFSVAQAQSEQTLVYGNTARQLFQVMADINLKRIDNIMSASQVDCNAPVVVGMGSLRACTLQDANAGYENIKIYNALAEQLAVTLVSITGDRSAASVNCGSDDSSSETSYTCAVITR